MTHLTIFAVAEKTGLDVQTIRDYEQMGVIAGPSAGDEQQPLYEESVVKRLSFIGHWLNLGTSLEEIKPLLALVSELNEPVEHIDEMKQKLQQDMETQKPSLDALRKELKEMSRL